MSASVLSHIQEFMVMVLVTLYTNSFLEASITLTALSYFDGIRSRFLFSQHFSSLVFSNGFEDFDFNDDETPLPNSLSVFFFKRFSFKYFNTYKPLYTMFIYVRLLIWPCFRVLFIVTHVGNTRYSVYILDVGVISIWMGGV